jgi:NAD(P)-dependent dehydrogenase (short-subunit alcohol dehydrogenase family)
VTGGAGGLGRMVALRAPEVGAAAVAVADRDLVGASETAARLPRGLALPVDVADRASVEAMVAEARAALGGIDVVVSAAGIFRGGDFLEATEDDWRALIEINAGGTFRVGQAAARVMVAQGTGGAIVHFSSFAARRATVQGSLYAASKGAVSSLTYAMAVALAPHGIRVNAVAPSPIATGLIGERFHDPEMRARMLVGNPTGRFGTPEEVASAVLYLASDAATFITGAVLPVDGGMSASR